MLNEGLSDAIKEVKDPERKINLWTAFIIVAALASVVVFLFKLMDNSQNEKYQSEVNRNVALDIENKALRRDKDSIIRAQYLDVLAQLKYQDSLNKEFIKVKRNLISK